MTEMRSRDLIETTGWRVRYQRRDPDSFMGRFGGGWQWKIGVQHGGSTTLISLLVAEVRIDRNTHSRPEPWWRKPGTSVIDDTDSQDEIA